MRPRVILGAGVVVVAGMMGMVAHASPAGRGTRHDHARRLQAMGRAWLEAGSPGVAAGYFRDAIRANPRAPGSYVALARIYLDRDDPGEALNVLEAGRRYLPDRGDFVRLAARAYAARNQVERAAQVLRDYLSRAPADVATQFARARLARRRGAWSTALASYRTILDLPRRGYDVDDEQLQQARRYRNALVILVGELDPVRGATACKEGEGVRNTPVRRALVGCRREELTAATARSGESHD